MVSYHRGEPRAGVETRIADAIREVCDEGNAVEFVIFEGGTGFVQFTVPGPALYGEAVANGYLEPAQQLSAAQIQRIHDLGWHPPTAEPGNFWQTWTQPDLGELATLVVATLAVYGAAPDEIAISQP
jgi:hypothetical protein